MYNIHFSLSEMIAKAQEERQEAQLQEERDRREAAEAIIRQAQEEEDAKRKAEDEELKRKEDEKRREREERLRKREETRGDGFPEADSMILDDGTVIMESGRRTLYTPSGVSKWNQCKYECCFCKRTTMSRSSMTSHIHNTHGIPIKVS